VTVYKRVNAPKNATARFCPDPPGELTVPPCPCCIYERADGKHRGRWEDGERTEGRGREGNDRKESEDVPHPKLNASCATAFHLAVFSTYIGFRFL